MSKPGEEIHISYKGIGIIIATLVGGAGMAGIGGFQLSSGASNAATDDIKKTIQAVIRSDAMMTPEEATEWADERDIQKHRTEHIDGTLIQHSIDIAEIKQDVYVVQKSVDANQATLEAIAEKVGADQ